MNKNQYTNSACFYDDIYPKSKYHEDIDFFKSILNNSSRVLELGCGTGRVAVELALFCKEVYAVDLSIEMLNILSDKINKSNIPNIFSVNANMVDFTIHKKFDLIIFPFNSFQSLTNIEDQKQCLENCKDMLSEGGIIIINLFNPNNDFLSNFSSFKSIDFSGEIKGLHLIRENFGVSHCKSSQVIRGKYKFTAKKENQIYNFIDEYELGYLYPEQLLSIINEINLVVLFQYENWFGGKFKNTSNQYILGVGA